ncbi:MAG: serine/threonine protein kinase, partial [Myxococcaceae bacterium]|nr:serine/threonine protein kinase [Myxococcaceae bacterium]
MRAAAANFEPGTELDDGKYRIVRFLGAGAMGAVFEAENTLTGGRVAIKCVRLSLDVRDSAGPRLLQEARMAARIRHPNVVHVYDVIRWEGHLGLVMEYLAGEPLTQHLSEQGLPVDRALSLLLPIMRGVAAAHRQGVIHRDIKPDNILLSREEESPHPVPKLLDFGIAK